MSKRSKPQRQQRQSLSTTYAGVAFSGPLPPPSVLERYNEIVPGAAERILAMAEAQSNHRRSLEKLVIGGNVIAQNRGQWMAYSLALIVIAVGTVLVWYDKPVAGLVAILGSLATLVSVFLIAKRMGAREREQKRKDLDPVRS